MPRSTLLPFLVFFAACSSSGTTGDGNATGGNGTGEAGPLAPLSTATLRPYDAALSYSTTIAGSGDVADIHQPTPLADGVRLPVVVFMQGANVDKAQYGDFADGLARFGFIVVVPNHATELFGTRSLFTTEAVLPQAFAQLVAEGTRKGAPLYGHVDETRLAVAGHSYGGMLALQALAGGCTAPLCAAGSYTRPTALRAGVFWGTNLGSAGSQIKVDTTGEPAALIQGAVDGKALPADGAATFEELAAPKDFFTVLGANHYGITNDAAPAGAAADSSTQSISQADSVLRVTLAAGVFLRAHVLDDAAARAILGQMHATHDGSVTLQDVH